MINKITVLIQMDPLDSLNKETDTTYKLATEALERGFTVMSSSPEDVFFESGQISVCANKLKLKKKDLEEKIDSKVYNLSFFDFILIRQDPPFDMSYITNTYLHSLTFKKSSKKPFFINNPMGLRNYSEKIYPLLFKNLIPNTIISCRKETMLSFLKKYKQIVIKPLFEKGGKGVLLIKSSDKNSIDLLKTVTKNYTQMIILQEYLKEIVNGDKRVILIDGEPMGVVNRVPLKGHFRANLHLGARPMKTILTEKEIDICNKLKPSLINNGFFFVGIDIIGEKLTEINVTSPTGISQINELYNTKIEKKFWDSALKKII